MKVMLSCGPSTRKVIDIISKLADGIDYNYYKNVKEFIRESKTRKVSFNRIIFTSNFLSKKPESDFKDLGNFLKDNSDSSEVIFVLQSPDESMESKFLKIFNSPLCTIAYVARPTPAALIDLVKESMPTVKAKFYELDKNKPVGGEAKEESVEVTLPGGSDSNTAINPSITDTNNSIEMNSTGDSESTGNDGVGNVDPYSSNRGISEYSGIQNDGSIPSGEDSYDDDDDDLSVGSFGSSHEDTGVFDEENEDEELKAHLERMNSQDSAEHDEALPEDVEHVVDEVVEDGPQEDYSGESEQEYIEESYEGYVEEENYEDDSYAAPEEYEVPGDAGIVKPELSRKLENVVLVTGLNGSGATQWIIDRAVEGVQKSKSVLIVDLDYTSAGILSFIDTEKFYAGNHNNFTPYQEDGVVVLSRGYGSKVTLQDFKRVERSFSNYDLVFIDCPVDCLSIFDNHSILNYRCFICSLMDISKIIEFSNKASSREYTSIKTEISLMQPDKVLYTNGVPTDEDLAYVRDMVFLPNGYWFD